MIFLECFRETMLLDVSCSVPIINKVYILNMVITSDIATANGTISHPRKQYAAILAQSNTRYTVYFSLGGGWSGQGYAVGGQREWTQERGSFSGLVALVIETYLYKLIHTNILMHVLPYAVANTHIHCIFHLFIHSYSLQVNSRDKENYSHVLESDSVNYSRIR